MSGCEGGGGGAEQGSACDRCVDACHKSAYLHTSTKRKTTSTTRHEETTKEAGIINMQHAQGTALATHFHTYLHKRTLSNHSPLCTTILPYPVPHESTPPHTYLRTYRALLPIHPITTTLHGAGLSTSGTMSG